jgi:hypothetical protein
VLLFQLFDQSGFDQFRTWACPHADLELLFRPPRRGDDEGQGPPSGHCDAAGDAGPEEAAPRHRDAESFLWANRTHESLVFHRGFLLSHWLGSPPEVKGSYSRSCHKRLQTLIACLSSTSVSVRMIRGTERKNLLSDVVPTTGVMTFVTMEKILEDDFLRQRRRLGTLQLQGG